MANKFLNQLQSVDTSTLEEEDRKCFMCWEEYGSHSSDRGVKEHAARLSCGHIVGSECIRLWLSDHQGHNTCPFCRRIQFQIPRCGWYNGHVYRGDQRYVPSLQALGESMSTFIERVNPAFWHHSDGEFSMITQQLLDTALSSRFLTLAIAAAYRSRVEREHALYDALRDRGAEAPRRDVAESQDQELSPTQASELFEYLKRRGAFERFWGGEYSRHLWTLLRVLGCAYEWNGGDSGTWKLMEFFPA